MAFYMTGTIEDVLAQAEEVGPEEERDPDIPLESVEGEAA